jgi:hypothetical protein
MGDRLIKICLTTEPTGEGGVKINIILDERIYYMRFENKTV